MKTAINIANFFVDYNNHCIDDTLTNLRLNKLLYFAQGYSLALYGKPLFNEEIEAWQHGPVIKSVYRAFKNNNRENISNIYGKYSYDDFDTETVELLLAVINDYGEYSSSKLIEITHQHGSPWADVYVRGENRIISQESIKKYFADTVKNSSSLKVINLDKIESIGYRDNTGFLVLPADWDDNEDYKMYLSV